jgi:hypothetical protein
MIPDRLRAANHRGVSVPQVLGFVLLAGLVLATLGVGLAHSGGLTPGGWASVGGSALVFAAGLVDDLAPPEGPRGIRGHLRALAAGRPSTGILKVVVTAGASVVVVSVEPARPAAVRLLGVVLLAACANLWNGLDVAPGRALKAFLVVDGLLLAPVHWPAAPGVAGLWVAAAVAVAWDLRERAMLGDAGANILGFTAGLGLYLALPDVGVAAAAIAAVGLNALAETVSLSRLIDAAPPVRWFDGLGRRGGGGADAVD